MSILKELEKFKERTDFILNNKDINIFTGNKFSDSKKFDIKDIQSNKILYNKKVV